MQHRHQAGGEIGLVVARRDADVVGRAAAKGMQADIEPPVVEIEAQRLHQPDAERLLPVYRERAFGDQCVGPRRLGVEGVGEQAGQEILELGEHGVDVLAPAAGLVIVEQGVVKA